jgi:hypothetical protein
LGFAFQAARFERFALVRQRSGGTEWRTFAAVVVGFATRQTVNPAAQLGM